MSQKSAKHEIDIENLWETISERPSSFVLRAHLLLMIVMVEANPSPSSSCHTTTTTSSLSLPEETCHGGIMRRAYPMGSVTYSYERLRELVRSCCAIRGPRCMGGQHCRMRCKVR